MCWGRHREEGDVQVGLLFKTTARDAVSLWDIYGPIMARHSNGYLENMIKTEDNLLILDQNFEEHPTKYQSTVDAQYIFIDWISKANQLMINVEKPVWSLAYNQPDLHVTIKRAIWFRLRLLCLLYFKTPFRHHEDPQLSVREILFLGILFSYIQEGCSQRR